MLSLLACLGCKIHINSISTSRLIVKVRNILYWEKLFLFKIGCETILLAVLNVSCRYQFAFPFHSWTWWVRFEWLPILSSMKHLGVLPVVLVTTKTNSWNIVNGDEGMRLRSRHDFQRESYEVWKHWDWGNYVTLTIQKNHKKTNQKMASRPILEKQILT